MSKYNAPYIDFHNHSNWHSDEVIEVVSIHGSQDKNATFYTIGYHPWWTDQILDESQLAILRNKYIADQNCLGIGEFGLDKLKGVSLDLQEKIVIQQIELANDLNAPVIIHCVRSYDRLMKLKKEYGKTEWVVHGFMRNKTLARQLLDTGIMLSIAPQDQMSSSFIEMMQFLPLDRLFLETDSDFRINIIDRYCIFATFRKMDLELIKVQLYQNFKTFYKQKWKYQNG